MTVNERTKYIEMTNATLNGKPARITGRLLDYAVIGQIDNPDIKVEFSWDAVRRIMERDGRFKI